MSFRFQFKLRTAIILIAGVAILFGVGRRVVQYILAEERHVATLDCGSGRQIIITADAEWERSQPLRYRVVVDEVTVVSKRYFDNQNPHETLRFSLVTADGGRLAGIVNDRHEWPTVVVIHDFVTGESWPASDSHYKNHAKIARLSQAFQRLQAENPGLHQSVSE